MNINNIVIYCDDLYTKANTNDRCKSCNNKCYGSCESCLKNIHFGDKRTYNCQNIANYYICKYIYKYSSEIQYLFEKHDTLRELEDMKILSIGCGPCTDLFGVINTIESNNLNTRLHYIGIDLNDVWKEIHEYIKKNNNANFIYDDIFNVVKDKKYKEIINSNILIFQYVLSDMIKNINETKIKDFIDNMIDNIIINLKDGSFIIFNDINHNSARKYFDYMLDELENKGIQAQYSRHHFNNSNKEWHYNYGDEYSCNNIKLDVPQEILDKYNSWTFCTSSQLIIKKGGK